MNERTSSIADIFRLNLKVASEVDPYLGEQETYEWLINEVLILAKCNNESRDHIEEAIEFLMETMNDCINNNDMRTVECINELIDSYEYYLDKYCPKFEVEEG